MQHPPFAKCCGPARHDVRPERTAGVGGDFTEAAAVPDSFPHYGLKVIVLCVLIAPFA